MSMDDMDRAHRADYRAKRAFDDAARALAAVLDDETATRRLGKYAAPAADLRDEFKRLSAHVVAVWD